MKIPVIQLSTNLSFLMVNMLGCGENVYAVCEDTGGHYHVINITDLKNVNPTRV